jgi:acetyltransferase-like isoleucine patch superfamily enzyme
MIKKFLRYFLYKIYEVGRQEANIRKRRLGILPLNRIATIHPEALINPLEINIKNNQLDKSKIVIGKCTQIRGELLIFKHGGEIIIGDYTFIASSARIWSAKKITIGSHVLISHNVNIHDNDSHPKNSIERKKQIEAILITGSLQFDNYETEEKEVLIEDDTWIGFNATILKGVTIGKGSIIGAHSLVTHDIPEFSIAVGNPAKIIGQVK